MLQTQTSPQSLFLGLSNYSVSVSLDSTTPCGSPYPPQKVKLCYYIDYHVLSLCFMPSINLTCLQRLHSGIIRGPPILEVSDTQRCRNLARSSRICGLSSLVSAPPLDHTPASKPPATPPGIPSACAASSVRPPGRRCFPGLTPPLVAPGYPAHLLCLSPSRCRLWCRIPSFAPPAT